MKIINPERFQRQVQDAQNTDFSGWEFSWLEGRMIQEDPPWHYKRLIMNAFSKTNSLLDLGTGGGEVLASLAPLPPDTHATESYPPKPEYCTGTPVAVECRSPPLLRGQSFTLQR